jgi:hypothetical protein
MLVAEEISEMPLPPNEPPLPAVPSAAEVVPEEPPPNPPPLPPREENIEPPPPFMPEIRDLPKS